MRVTIERSAMAEATIWLNASTSFRDEEMFAVLLESSEPTIRWH